MSIERILQKQQDIITDSTGGGASNIHSQTLKTASKEQKSVSCQTTYWQCSPEQSESVSPFHLHFFPRLGSRPHSSLSIHKISSQFSQCTSAFLRKTTIISLSHLCLQFCHIIYSCHHPNLSYKAFLCPCLPQFPEVICT